MVDAMKTWGTWAVLVAALMVVAWLARPVPPATQWPQSSAQAQEQMAQKLAVSASRAWTQGKPEHAWQAARVLHEAFPDTPQARRVAPHLGKLEAAAKAATKASKWEYTELESAGWGRLVQASIAAEPLAFSPDLPDSFLVVRSGPQPRHRAVFFVPGVPMPPECQAQAGCVIEVGASQYRIRPVPDQAGWWVFSDFTSVASKLELDPGLSLKMPTLDEETLRFDTSGVDLSRLGLR